MDKRPCFSLIIRANFLHYEPLIPPSFIRHVRTLATQKATLKCSSGGIWSIQLHKTRNSVFFRDGWNEFAVAHSLRENDFVLFNHDGNMCFDVRIFDPCGFERLQDGCEQEKKRLNRRDLQTSAHCQSNRGNGIYGTSESFQSRFPFFLKHLKEYHVEKNFTLQVPTGFARKYLPSEKTKITLCNPEGKSWKVSLNPGPNQTNFGGGWKTYVSDNKLRRGQVCAFELVDDLELRVHTFRS